MKKNISVLLILLFITSNLYACSVMKVTARDGTIVSGRTMEFGNDIKPTIVVVPRGQKFVSPSPTSPAGLVWKTKYGYVGITSFGVEASAMDGMNETGLAFSALWYEKNTKWQDVARGEEKRALAHALIGPWILANFSTVEEVKKEIKKIKVFGLVVPEMGGAPPLHFAVYDAKGGAIVIEYDSGQSHVYDNPLGIMTNAPNFPWMMTNLRNYVGMNTDMLTPQNYSGVTLLPTGHGTGMFGLPGDISPPSRFVRLAVTTHFASPPADAKGALNLAQHIIYSLEIVDGMVVDKDASGKILSSETTQWAAFRDLTNKVFYYRTYDNFTLRKIDMKKLDFNSKKIKNIPMYGDGETIIDITDRF